ncbi:MAG: antibiotic biosynthesis monooxygenase [Kiritimatiellae bacterium]|nr:antibiotic biosynthesis monooxygenase [Kiritimatiellia bacterium]
MATKARKELVCIAQFTAKPGKEDELINSLHSLMEPTHKEKGCIRYELNQRDDDPRIVTFIEKWASKAVFDKHCSMPYIANYFQNVAPQLVEKQDVSIHTEILP